MTDDSNAPGGNSSDELWPNSKERGAGAEISSAQTSGINTLDPALLAVESEGRVLTARGTEDGLVLRIDGGAEWADILTDIENFLGGRRKFFVGGEVSIEWLERLPTKEQCSELEVMLKEQYGLTISPRRRRPARVPMNRAAMNTEKGSEMNGRSGSSDGTRKGDSGRTIPLFEDGSGPENPEATAARPASVRTGSRSPFAPGAGYEHISSERTTRSAGYDSKEPSILEEIELLASGKLTETRGTGETGARKSIGNVKKVLGDDLFYEDDANAKVVYGTVRSGQRLETPFSLIVVGDVNPGADLVAGGDIIVLGSLRGTAHAAAYDDDAFDRVIIALQMQPMQLRIGSIISRGSDDVVSGAEIARIENRKIVVEAFSARGIGGRRW